MLVGFCKISAKSQKWCLSPFYHVYQDRLVVLPSSEVAHFNVLYSAYHSSLAKTGDIRLSKIEPFQRNFPTFCVLEFDSKPFLLFLHQIDQYYWRTRSADHQNLVGRYHEKGVFCGLEHVHMDYGSVWFQVNHLWKESGVRRSKEDDECVADGSCNLFDGVLGGRGEDVFELQHQSKLQCNNLVSLIILFTVISSF